MKFLATVALLAIGVAASPVDIEERSGGGSYQPCPAGLFSVPQCCATDVLGVIGLNCDAPPEAPHSANHFRDTCHDVGQQARCCVAPAAGQALLCTTPAGI
ncbi:Trihydrophobin-like protein [Hapsidospora chrysogenum ATCC 11550]|uniref:Trihydrophobin-like protein n=1 Tax=Hapsidospora chrysogenum (strain ATCC 11550 / CBS 779.69 / DSM 880 / IAM 14645 / JCM 23072 / IMI 49137) TaxID=857340 RepID=A0A086T3N9_HAPC1|nr:Trihydrophobin-like protein [Hapsidospora chrysogenum ATCC 11550]